MTRSKANSAGRNAGGRLGSRIEGRNAYKPESKTAQKQRRF